ncbi:probable arabinosyltransferase ARAD1 [Cryptomeria japonica]|uniref:probable arabinosyltransferase ARAD1 n=1 Tax=Cryptomeria japonica TaxID=3369 RepID=UPI0027DA6DBD|nr:probable arabinosyltransferase ARAD1 [Cryptomeria japonica]XP_059068135.1 probable arabinosyltransferase ARAD1 [Cryptomeria japonica]XP_059068136.1 probable arabinosyltransferase ARAD1 [Cryptomeria japonica]
MQTTSDRKMQPKKMALWLVFLISALVMVYSLAFLQISDRSLIGDRYSSFLDPKLRVVYDDGNPLYGSLDDMQSSSISSAELQSENENWSLTGSESDSSNQCDPQKAALKVYMYNLPPEFHFGMLEWKPESSVWPTNLTQIPRYPGGLNLQHSPEYWLTMDLLSSNMPGRSTPCTAWRVERARDADVFFVPFFSSLSYNRHSKVEPHERKSRNEILQDKLVHFLMGQEAWRRSGGKNHVIVMHHPNSMSIARGQLRSAMFIVSDFGRYSPLIGNVEKDIVAPYKHVVRSFTDDSSSFESRTTLLFFQGAIFRKDGGFIRQELYALLKNEKGVYFTSGNTQSDGIRKATQGMRSSKFCLNIAGDTPSSNRLFDAIASHCVPVIISDEIELPYEDKLDYSEFCIFVQSDDARKKGFLINLLNSIKREEWTSMWRRLKEVGHHFEYQYPTQPDDAVHMIWKAVARKLPSIKLSLHKGKRYSRSWLAKQSKSFFSLQKLVRG